MLIDLHCHTKATKRGDGKKRNVDAATFVSRVSRAGVGIVAITNHNVFDLDQYKEFVCAANDAFQIWPGVELDVTSGAEGSHCICLLCARLLMPMSLITLSRSFFLAYRLTTACLSFLM